MIHRATDGRPRTGIPDELLKAKTLSAQALGVLCHILHFSDTSDVRVCDLCRSFRVGRKGMRVIMAELVLTGHARIRSLKSGGRFLGRTYDISEGPIWAPSEGGENGSGSDPKGHFEDSDTEGPQSDPSEDGAPTEENLVPKGPFEDVPKNGASKKGPCNTIEDKSSKFRKRKRKNNTKSKNPPLPPSPEGPLGGRSEIVTFPGCLDHPSFWEKWEEYIAYRKKNKIKPLQDDSVVKQLRRMEPWGLSECLQAIDESIANGWTGLFKPKNGAPKKNGVMDFGRRETYNLKADEVI